MTIVVVVAAVLARMPMLLQWQQHLLQWQHCHSMALALC